MVASQERQGERQTGRQEDRQTGIHVDRKKRQLGKIARYIKGKKEPMPLEIDRQVGTHIEIDRQVGTHIDVGWFYFKI